MTEFLSHEAPAHDAAALPVNVPPRLIGREAALAQVYSQLKVGKPALVFGAPGAGKTALAATLANAYTQQPGGVLWLNVDNDSLESLLVRVGRAYDLAEVASADNPLAMVGAVAAALMQHKPLIVLDGRIGAQIAAKFVTRCADRLPVILVSRENLEGPWSELRLQLLEAPSAVALFKQEAMINDATADTAVAQIVKTLSYQPFAISVAARAMLASKQQSAAFATNLAQIATSVGTNPATIALTASFAALNGALQGVVLVLSAMFGAEASGELLSMVAGAPEDSIHQAMNMLVGLRLVERTYRHLKPYYRLHMLTQAFAQERLKASDRLDALQQKALEQAAAYAAKYAASPESQNKLALEVDNLLAAARWAAAHDKRDLTGQIAGALASTFAGERGYHYEVATLRASGGSSAAFPAYPPEPAAAPADSGDTPRPDIFKMLDEIDEDLDGDEGYDDDDGGEESDEPIKVPDLFAGLAIDAPIDEDIDEDQDGDADDAGVEDLDDEEALEVDVDALLGDLDLDEDLDADLDDEEDVDVDALLAEEGLAGDELDDEEVDADVLEVPPPAPLFPPLKMPASLSAAPEDALVFGAGPDADEDLDAELDIEDEDDDEEEEISDQVDVLDDLVDAVAAAAPDEMTRLRGVLVKARQSGDVRRQIMALLDIGKEQVAQSMDNEAIATYNEALNGYESLNDKLGALETLDQLAALTVKTDNAQAAVLHAGRGVKIAEELNDTAKQMQLLMTLGDARQQLGESDEAETAYAGALEIARRRRDSTQEGVILYKLGYAQLDNSQPELAVENWEQALKLFRIQMRREYEGKVMGALGSAYGDLGRWSEAINLHNSALHMAREVGDREEEALQLASLGYSSVKANQLPQAVLRYRQSLHLAYEMSDRDTVVSLIVELVRMLMRSPRHLTVCELLLDDALDIDSKDKDLNALSEAVAARKAEAVGVEFIAIQGTARDYAANAYKLLDE
jgi:tetratricopeptide (TPR) repeat protein